MFLVVFVTLVISIIGVYAQVLGIQTSRLNAAQYGASQTMLAWHSAATALAKTGMTVANYDVNGCSLTAPTCPTTNVAGSGFLPPGYRTVYTFTSIAFLSPNPSGRYVITYVHDTDAATGMLILPATGGTMIGTKLSDLSQQFSRSLPAYFSYGKVTSAGIFTALTHSGNGPSGQLTYYIPATIPVGSVALISAAQ